MNLRISENNINHTILRYVKAVQTKRSDLLNITFESAIGNNNIRSRNRYEEPSIHT